MFNPSYLLLYVSKPETSAALYSELLGLTPVELSPTFAMFKLTSGVMLGLWASETVEPPATAAGGGELAYPVNHRDEVNAIHANWVARGLKIAQTPCMMDFGYTFVGQDADGHRLRVFAPAA